MPSLNEDRIHMLAGIVGEIGELTDAYKRHLIYGNKLDKTNVLEEIGDTVWYITNWANICGVSLTEPKETPLCYDSGEPIERNPIDLLFHFLRTLHMGFHQNIVDKLYSITLLLGFDVKDFYIALTKNIEKLKIRYPEGFTEEKALNRDIVSERKILENA